MKKLLLTCCSIVALAGSAAASSYSSMIFKTIDGKSYTVSSTGLVVTYDGSNILVSNSASESLTFPAVNLISMQFGGEVSSVDAIGAEFANEVDVYDLTGIFLARFNSISAAREALPSGVYIVKASDSKTLKIKIEK